MTETAREYLTIEEAAEMLGVEYKTIYRLVRSGELPAGRIGRVYRILRGDLEGFFQGQKEILSGGAREQNRCGACGQSIVSELSIAGHCEVCGATICPACWTVKKIHRCREHGGAAHTTPAGKSPVSGGNPFPKTDRVAELRKAGKAVIATEESAVAEATFIREFLQRVGKIDFVRDPLTDVPVRPADARVRHDEQACETGKISRFIFRTGGWGKPKGGVAVEGRYLVHAQALRQQGYDAEPLGRMELQKLTNSLAAEQAYPPLKDNFRVVQIGSPTGFAADAEDWLLRGGARGNDLVLGLADLHEGTFIVDEGDERLVCFHPLLAPAIWEAKLASATQAVEKILAGQKSLTLANAMTRTSQAECVLRAAFASLAGNDYTVDELDDLGLVLSRKQS